MPDPCLCLQALSSDKDYILAALRKSSGGIIEVSGDSVRRNPGNPLPDLMKPEKRREIRGKTMYAVS